MIKSESLLEQLEKYCPGAVPMHMPGHKRNIETAEYLKRLGADIDITEIDGFDDMNDADGILLGVMERAASVWGAERSFIGVNGSTGGILAAVFAVLNDGDEVICARNCHKAVYNALSLRRAKVHFIYPEKESFAMTESIVAPELAAEALKKHPGAKAVILTSPSYEGIVSDISSICRIAHSCAAAVIVDEAHGAHLGFGGGFPESAVHSGADIVIQSLHKTLPSLTQTALIHARGGLIDIGRLQSCLSIFQTSSPSYLLMASIDGCIRLMEERGAQLTEKLAAVLQLFHAECRLSKLEIIKKTPEMFDLDPGKLVISTRKTDISGRELMNALREKYGIEAEMAAADYIIAMTGLGDTKDNLLRLAGAINEIDSLVGAKEKRAFPSAPRPERAFFSWELEKNETAAAAPEKSAGEICAEYIWAYPPGRPLIIPGEIIDDKLIELLGAYEAAGIPLKSSSKGLPEKILIAKKR